MESISIVTRATILGTFLGLATLATAADNAIPRSEHPRPDQFRESWMTLNGEWQFEIDDKADGEIRGLIHDKDLVLRDKLRKGTNIIAIHFRKQRNATYLDLAILVDQ